MKSGKEGPKGNVGTQRNQAKESSRKYYSIKGNALLNDSNHLKKKVKPQLLQTILLLVVPVPYTFPCLITLSTHLQRQRAFPFGGGQEPSDGRDPLGAGWRVAWRIVAVG